MRKYSVGKQIDGLRWDLQRAFHGSRPLEGVFRRQRARLDVASVRQRRSSGRFWPTVLAWAAVAVLCAVYMLNAVNILFWVGVK